jgi:hypothetical protein
MGRQRNIRRSRETTPTRDLRCQDDGVYGRKPKKSEKPAPAKCGSKKPLECNRPAASGEFNHAKGASSRRSASCHNLCNIEHPLCRFHGATNRHHAPELARAHFFEKTSDVVGVDAIAGHHQPNDRVPQELFEDGFLFARHFSSLMRCNHLFFTAM